MKALRYSDHLELTNTPFEARDGEALVRVLFAGICNTDLEIVKGYAGFHGTLGHEFVGRVESGAPGELIGKRVVGEINAGCGRCELCGSRDPRHCKDRTVLGIKGRDGAFAEFLSLPAANLLAVPDAISDEQAVFIEPLAAALNIREQVELSSGMRVGIIGDGKLAQLIVLAVAPTGCDLTVIGKHRERLALAERGGANDARLFSERAQVGALDVVIEASGSAAGLQAAIEMTRPRGTVVLKTTHHGATTVEMSPVVVNELTIIGSRCGRFETAIEFLLRRKPDFTSFISERFDLDFGVEAFKRAAEPGVLKVLLKMTS